jgi:hypothetical protein
MQTAKSGMKFYSIMMHFGSRPYRIANSLSPLLEPNDEVQIVARNRARTCSKRVYAAKNMLDKNLTKARIIN